MQGEKVCWNNYLNKNLVGCHAPRNLHVAMRIRTKYENYILSREFFFCSLICIRMS